MFSLHATAQSSSSKQLPNQLSVITETCLISPYQCLEKIDHVLGKTPAKSRLYFEILQYKFEALFNLQRIEQLYNETKQWLNQPNLPIPFQITNAIYFAKSSYDINDSAEARKSYLFAKATLKEMNNEYPSPLRLIQFANLQMSLGEFEDAYQLLSHLAKNYPTSPDIRFMMELHGNLGHCAHKMGDLKQSLKHWQTTLKWAKQMDNKQQLAVSLYNLAEIHFKLGQYEKAQQINMRSAAIANEAKDVVRESHALYNRTDSLIHLQKICQAKNVFQTINQQVLPPSIRKLVPKMEKTLQACSQ